MPRRARAIASHFFRNAPAYAVLSIGLALTVSAHEYVAANLRMANKRAFDEESDDVLARLRRRIDTYKTLTFATRALFTGTSMPTREEFEAFARHVQMPDHAPGMHGLGYAFFDRGQGFVQLGTRIRTLPANPWLESPEFRESIAAARDEGRAIATSRISMDSCVEGKHAPGFVLYVPIYGPGQTSTVDQRREATRGVVFATFCSDSLLAGLLSAHTRRTVDVELYDGDEAIAEALISDSDPNERAEDPDRYARDVKFEVGGKTWLIRFNALGPDDPDTAAMLPRLVAFGGVMLSILLFAIVLSQVRSRNIAEAGERRSQIVANASRVFTAYIDEREALREVARFVVPHVADWCAITVFESGTSEVSSFGLVNVDEAVEKQLVEACAALPTSSLLLAGQTELVADLRYAGAATSLADELLARFRVRSLVRAPMSRQGELLGVVTLITTRHWRRLGSNDVLLANELARIILTSIDSARLYRRTQEASRLKDEFLATLSHELRTPLNAILGWSHLLRTTPLDDSARLRALETIERNARQQNQIVSDLLDVSRIILGQVSLDRAPIDLGEVLNEAIASQKLAAEAKRIEVRVSIDPGAAMVLGDRGRLHQIVWNLVSNAMKFTPTDGRVEVSLEKSEDFTNIVVKDTGQGISPDFLPHIFHRFRQADASSTRAHGGLGLGLAIVRHLVELHGGTVQASSEGPGKGATFVARIPAAATVATLETAKREAERRGTSLSGEKQQAS